MSDCSKTQDGNHVPDWKTVHVEVDGDGIYVDVKGNLEWIDDVLNERIPPSNSAASSVMITIGLFILALVGFIMTS